MYFWNYRLWKTWLGHSLKSAVSEHALTVNMWKLPKYLQNLDESASIMFFHYSSGSWFSTLNFNHFGKKDDRHSECTSEITDCEKLG